MCRPDQFPPYEPEVKCMEIPVRRGGRCGRPATDYVYYLREWRPICQFHRRPYMDLPMRRIEVQP